MYKHCQRTSSNTCTDAFKLCDGIISISIAYISATRCYMWQSRVEFEGYSVAYFNRISAFEASYRWTSTKGGTHTCFVDAWISNESTKRTWALPLTEVHFERSDAIEIRDRITFDFYTGLPHVASVKAEWGRDPWLKEWTWAVFFFFIVSVQAFDFQTFV